METEGGRGGWQGLFGNGFGSKDVWPLKGSVQEKRGKVRKEKRGKMSEV